MNTPMYAGIDLHKKYSYITIMDQQGIIHHQGRYNHQDNTLIPTLVQYNTSQATVESTYGWYWLADKLDESKIPFKLAHPAKVNAIVGSKKTDKEDSQALAHLLRTNLLPMSYIPTHEERSLKELLRFRMYSVNQRSTVKRKLHDVLAKQNIVCEYSDILGKQAVEWLQQLECPYPYQDEIKSLLTYATTLTQEIDQLTRQVETHVQEYPAANLLTTMPGIGDILGLTIAVEVGDIRRFKNDRSLASYAGIVPSVHSSGDKTHYGPIPKRGNPYIRWALSEAVPHAIQKDPGLKIFYERIKQKKGGSKAIVAVMNKLVRSIYVMLTYQKAYQIHEVVTGTKE